MDRRRLTRGLLLAALGLSLTVAVSEVFVRMVIDPRIDLRNKPHATYIYAQREYTMTVQLNSDGFRDEPFDPNSPETYRVVILGDSFAFGWGVDVEQAFPNLLEGLLAKRLGRPAVVYNLSTEGSNVDLYLEHLKRFGPKLRPDLVLVAYFMGNGAVARPRANEKYPTTISGWAWKYLNKLKLVRFVRARRLKKNAAQYLGMEFRQRDVRGVRNPMLDLLASTDPTVQTRLRRLEKADLRDALIWRVNPFTLEQVILAPRLADHLERQRSLIEGDPTTREILKAIHNEATRLGARMVCILIPTAFQVQPSAVEALKRLGYEADGPLVEGVGLREALVRLLRGLSIETLDLTLVLRSLTDEPFYRLDGHFTPEGHRVAAQAIATFLSTSVK